jgi:phosphonate transport system substrate-binding protein
LKQNVFSVSVSGNLWCSRFFYAVVLSSTLLAAAHARPLVIGTLSTRPDFHVPRMLPLAELVAGKLGDFGISGARVLLAKDIPQLCAQMRAGQLDWVTVTIAASFTLVRDCGAQAELRAVDAQGAVYQTVFFARKDSGLQALEDLIGKRLALRNRGSTSSFVIPKILLRRAHLPMQALRTRHESNAPDQINLVLAGSETNSALWVVHGLADVSVANSIDWQDETLFPRALRDRLKIIYQSPPIPLGLELIRKDLPPAFRQRLIAAMQSISPSAAGQAALHVYANAERFEPIPLALTQTLAEFAAEFDALQTQEGQ